jgi:mono/diheme cytochrome c family protein
MINRKFALAMLTLSIGLIAFAGYRRPYVWWPFNDMSEQIVIRPFNEDSLRAFPEGSVSTQQWDPVPLKTDPAVLETLVNPIEATAESVAMGKGLYETYCWPCHGTEMAPTPDMMSPVGLKGMPAANIHLIKLRTDASIYSTITHGNAIMKRLDYHLDPDERWHIVNYVRSVANKYSE